MEQAEKIAKESILALLTSELLQKICNLYFYYAIITLYYILYKRGLFMNKLINSAINENKEFLSIVEELVNNETVQEMKK